MRLDRVVADAINAACAAQMRTDLCRFGLLTREHGQAHVPDRWAGYVPE